MPLWNKKNTLCAALLISASFAPESLAQRLSPLAPLPMPPTTVAQKSGAGNSIFELAPAPSKTRRTLTLNPLKPIATPGAPIVKLAQRPVFKSSALANPVMAAKPALTPKSKPAPLTPLLNQVSGSAKTAATQPVAQEELPVARTAHRTPNKITALAEKIKVATASTAVGMTSDFPLAASTPSVVVRSPFVQPGNPNRYLFVVENVGTVDAGNTRVDLRVPAGVVLKQVVADSASSTARHAIVRIDGLKAGAKSIMEVEIQPTDVEVKFDTSLTLETKQSFQGLTLPKTSYVSAPAATPVPAAQATASRAVTQVAARDKASTPLSPIAVGDGNLSATLEGPVILPTGETSDFSITIKNPNAKEASNVIVQLRIPEGIKITTLDREAWINDDDNTISWELSSVGGRQQETIQYKAVGKSFGQQVQKVTLGVADVYQGDSQLVTLVSQ